MIVADAQDADLLRDRRWRAYPPKPWMPHKVEVRGGSGRGLALHQHVMAGEKWVQVVNGSGCDVRRENLRRMSRTKRRRNETRDSRTQLTSRTSKAA